MLSKLNDLRLGLAFFRLADNPYKTDEVFKIADAGIEGRATKGIELALRRAMANEGFRRLLEERYLAPEVDWQRLEELPDGTLGKEYFRHMRKNGLQPDFFPEKACRNEVEYLIQRGRESHDIWHVLAGYGTTVIEELALQGFTLAQLDSPISGVILSAGILYLTREDPARLRELLVLLDEAQERGGRAEYLLGVPWEKHWEMPLEEARRWMGIPLRRGAASIYGTA